jgi:hypothetical protein
MGCGAWVVGERDRATHTHTQQWDGSGQHPRKRKKKDQQRTGSFRHFDRRSFVWKFQIVGFFQLVAFGGVLQSDGFRFFVPLFANQCAALFRVARVVFGFTIENEKIVGRAWFRVGVGLTVSLDSCFGTRDCTWAQNKPAKERRRATTTVSAMKETNQGTKGPRHHSNQEQHNTQNAFYLPAACNAPAGSLLPPLIFNFFPIFLATSPNPFSSK